MGELKSGHVKGESLKNVFSSNLNTVNQKVFPNHGGMEGFIPEVNSYGVLKVVPCFPHAGPDLRY